MKISHSEIDKKVCTYGHSAISGARSNKGKKFTATPSGGSSGSDGATSQCSGLGDRSPIQDPKLFSNFVETVKIAEDKNWPTGGAANDSNVLVEGAQNSNANAVAKDLVALNPEKKP
ncbi:hypothetical protein ANAPH2_00883 [Anaplasma phagocytophilum]|nr:hypothetical protein ANAPH2_00883 [Anaplasma phagocytophilum]